MGCENLVGVKNISISFTNCETEEVIRSISHKLATDALPSWRTCAFSNEMMPNGYTKRSSDSAGVELNIVRDLRIPLSYYQGCATLDIQVEYENGIVMTGLQGGVLGNEKSDTHEVSMDVAFRTLDELLPANTQSLVTA